MRKILLIGYKSFVSTGLYEKLISIGYEVDCYSRKADEKNLNFISGDVFEMSKNPKFKNAYDIIVNFVLLKDKGLDENIRYITFLNEFCKLKQVQHLIHFSSIMVYPNLAKIIDETTVIEQNSAKKGYGEIKIEVDKYLLSQTNLPFKISLIRPGYVLAEGRACPFIKQLPMGISIIKGDKKSVQPIVKREDIHQALLNMIELGSSEPVYLFTPSKQTTKYEFAKQTVGGVIISLPKGLILGFSKLLLNLKVISPSLYVRIEGMYIESIYNSEFTENALKIKF